MYSTPAAVFGYPPCLWERHTILPSQRGPTRPSGYSAQVTMVGGPRDDPASGSQHLPTSLTLGCVPQVQESVEEE